MGEIPKKPPERDSSIPAEPISPLGQKLREIRRRIVANGEPLLSWDELEKELAERRGGVPGE